MSIEVFLLEKRGEILQVAAKHGVSRIQVFGSCARSEARPDSDVDLLVEVGGPTSPWFPGGLVADLEELLGRRVEVVEREGLYPWLRDHVLDEAIPL